MKQPPCPYPLGQFFRHALLIFSGVVLLNAPLARSSESDLAPWGSPPGVLIEPITRLRTLTYNVWALPNFLIRKPERLARIAHALPATGADLIALQETFNSRAQIFGEIPDYPFVAYGPTSGTFRTSSGLMLLSKFPIVETATITYGECTGTDCFANKGALYARVKSEGLGEIDVFTTHMNASDPGPVRAKQIEELMAFVEKYSGPRPLVMLGDFNFPPDSPGYGKLVEHLRVHDGFAKMRAQTPGLRMVAGTPEGVAASTQNDEGFTADPLRNLNLIGKSRRCKRIDYTFFRAVAAMAMKAVSSTLAFDVPVDGMHLSDHFGVLTELEVHHLAVGDQPSLSIQ